MPTPTKGPRLGSGPAHERLMLANLASSLFEHGRIVTTQAKAKRLRPVAERLITFAKRGDLAARRRVMTVIRDKSVVHELFTEIGPRYENRHGGYTRIVKLGPRKGDNAPMAVIELVEALAAEKPKRQRATKRAKPVAGAATAGAVEEALASEDTNADTDAATDADTDAATDAATEADVASGEPAAGDSADHTADDSAENSADDSADDSAEDSADETAEEITVESADDKDTKS